MTNINFTVTYNKISKACQINVITIEKNEKIEYIDDGKDLPPQIVEISAIEQMRSGKRKDQNALIVIMSFVVVGIVGYHVIGYYHDMRTAAEKAKIEAGNIVTPIND